MKIESVTNWGRLLSIGTCVLGLAGASVIAAAQESPMGERREVRRIMVMQDGGDFMRDRGRMGPREDSMIRWLNRMGDEIGLTPQQRGKLTEHAATARPEMNKLRQELREQRRVLQELSPGDPKYAAVSAEAAKRIGELASRLAQQGIQLRSKVWAELTPEQRTKALSLRDQMKARRKAMGERVRYQMAPPPPPPPR